MDGLAPPLVGLAWKIVVIDFGRQFFKMSGSGNDFVFFDARSDPAGELESPEAIGRLCARGLGIGSDGVVFLEKSQDADIGIRYFNRDGSLADLCGNASLCATRLATELGAVNPKGFRLETGAGILSARIQDGLPQIDLIPVTELKAEVPGLTLGTGEERLGFAIAGVPHAVIASRSVEESDVLGRGAQVRHDSAFPDGANVNFVTKQSNGVWRYRTYERGVEGETLACGTGAVAVATLLKVWDLSGDSTDLLTTSGKVLQVSLRHSNGAWYPSLRGEGRLVYSGRLGETG